MGNLLHRSVKLFAFPLRDYNERYPPLDLMSGSNSNMTLVANVAEDLDGTDPSLSPYTWTCPDVDPYSTIYFYQFTPAATADKSDPAWTTRFTVR